MDFRAKVTRAYVKAFDHDFAQGDEKAQRFGLHLPNHNVISVVQGSGILILLSTLGSRVDASPFALTKNVAMRP